MSYTVPSDTSSGSYLEKPGSYHFYVVSIKEKPVIDNEIKEQIHMHCQVLAGTEPSEVDHTVTIRLTLPSPEHKDGGNFVNRVLYRMARSLGLLPMNVRPGQTIDDPVWKNGENGQFIANIIMGDSSKNDGKKYANIDGAKIFHVDDTECSATPKSEPHLALLPPEKRLTGTGPTTTPAEAVGQSKPTQAPQPQATETDFSDIF